MNREDVLNSISLKKRFCKDYSLPITVFDNPYFYERLQILDDLFDCISKFDEFCYELEKYQAESDYFEYYNKVKDSIINYIKNKPEYILFNNLNNDVESVVSKKKKNVYSVENDGDYFISIDMKKANFSAMRHYDPNIFDWCKTWEEFVAKFTDSKHIQNSKYIRQVILGACNPKKQIQYEHKLMNILCQHLINNIPGIDIYSLGEDEIIISLQRKNVLNPNISMNKLKRVVNDCPFGIGLFVRVQIFELKKIENTDGFMKILNLDNSQIQFKCLDAEIYHQIVKYYNKQLITENDLVFYHNGKLARFLEPIKNPWSE